MSGVEPRGGRAVFQSRDYCLYLSSRFLWGIASQMQNVAIAWLVYALTHDAFALGLIGLATILPALPLSLITGAVADRFDRRRIVLICYSLYTVCSALLIFTAYEGLVWPVYGLVVFAGSLRAFVNPAAQALMASTVPDEHYASAAAWFNSTTQTANIIGPAIGGLLFPLGTIVPFSVSFGCFALATLSVMRVSPRPAKGRSKAPVTWSMIVAGYHFIWSCPVVLGAITLDLVAVLLGGATALLPIYAGEIFRTGPWGLGLLRAMPAVGAIFAALILAHYPLGRRVGRSMFACVAIYGMATIGFGLSQSIWPAMVCLVVLGSADVISVVIRSSLIQIETPDAMRGRVIAVHSILTNTSNNLGDFESGTLASFVGAVPAVVTGGIGALLAVVVWIRLFPQLWERDELAIGRPAGSEKS